MIMWPYWPKVEVIEDFMAHYIEEYEKLCVDFGCQVMNKLWLEVNKQWSLQIRELEIRKFFPI